MLSIENAVSPREVTTQKWCRNWGGGSGPSKYLLTLFKPGRVDYARHLLLPPPQIFSPSGITAQVHTYDTIIDNH